MGALPETEGNPRSGRPRDVRSGDDELSPICLASLESMWRSVEKYAAGFEIIHAQPRTQMVTLEQTKIMIAFLRCLRFNIGGLQLEPEPAMWTSNRTLGGQPPQRNWYGSGLLQHIASLQILLA